MNVKCRKLNPLSKHVLIHVTLIITFLSNAVIDAVMHFKSGKSDGNEGLC